MAGQNRFEFLGKESGRVTAPLVTEPEWSQQHLGEKERRSMIHVEYNEGEVKLSTRFNPTSGQDNNSSMRTSLERN